ncbi:hypothetical protein OH76DRAFT_1418666 [Lentinus brumalis]|uniref:Uncharacterized protein n=1 Tax=Lentinus brumalis TaxID=2498619 RepID=A0A371D8Q2_9APHY|nr:hypothetical protein OH76DRAFT_1418666 [Polyporus brumalis]
MPRPVSTSRRFLALSSESTLGSSASPRLTRAYALSLQEEDLSDVPVATDDEETLKGSQEPERRERGTPQNVADNELPSSSPIESFTDVNVSPRSTHQEVERESTVESYTTDDMWASTGNVPSSFLFDDHEAGPREEGEVEEAFPRMPRATVEDQDDELSDEEREAYQRRVEKVDDLMSKHQTASSPSGLLTTLRKCSWNGSVASEERSRLSRGPRRETEGEKEAGVRLPSINELVGNPWRGNGDENGSSVRNPVPVHASTPRLNQQSPRSYFAYHSEADVSGKAPMPHSTSTVAPTVRSQARGAAAGEWAGERYPKTAARACSVSSHRSTAMDVEDLQGDPLLGTPSLRRARQERNRRELEELEERRSALQQALLDSPGECPDDPPLSSQQLWHGGYAPEMMRQGRGERHEAPRRKAVDSLLDQNEHPNAASSVNGGEHGGNSASHRDHWSAVPNTKAWQYREERRERERNERTEGRRVFTGDGRFESGRDSATPRHHASEVSSGRWETRSGPNRGPGARVGVFEDEQDEEAMDFERSECFDEADGVRSGPLWTGGPMPSIVAREETATDLPVTVEDPNNDRWIIHFDDPEALIRGQSADFIKIVWLSQEPTVIFSVYNYKYTENDAVNRHIEAAVTNLTALLTGEKGFDVVPPDPESRNRLQSRDLPFTWAIRGLSEAGAWEMMRMGVATTRGVSIITHPRSLANPRWVCGLGGFLRPNPDAIKKTVLVFLRSEYMLSRLADLTRSSNSLRHIHEDNRVEYVLRSLKVKVTTTKEGSYVANIYITPPTDDMDAWREWAGEMRAHRFNAFICGAGVATRVFWCSGCRGVDHETEDCVFPRMKGWKGPDAGSGSHTKLQVEGLPRVAGNRGRGGQTATRARGAVRVWTGASGEQEYGGNQSFFSRGGPAVGRGNGRGRGSKPGRGTRGNRWHPMGRG